MTDDGKNDPLPVRSREKAEYDARALIDQLTEVIDTHIDPATVHRSFRDCVGKNGETADDGRFDLDYWVEAPLPGKKHNAALRVLKKKLKSESFTIKDYREGDWRHVLLYAKGGKDDFFVSVGAVRPPDERLVLSVTTPCFLPPGVEQEQVSAPVAAGPPAGQGAAAGDFG